MKQYHRVIDTPTRSFFLFGVRGIGKSSWLKGKFSGAQFVDLLLESTYQGLLADPEAFRRLVGGVRADDWVVIDEIQRLPQLLNEVHFLIEEKKVKFAMSGSSSRKLKKAGTNLLAGRAIRKELFPLQREELGEDFDLEKILQIGSLPLIWQSAGDRDVMESYVHTYLKEEIQAEALVRNLPGFHRFLPVAALYNGNTVNVSNISREAGVKRTTVNGYLEILEDTLMTFPLFPFEGKLRVKEKKHPKLYWIDPGIVRTIKKTFGSVAPEEKGHLFESWFASTLRAYQSYRRLFDDWKYWSPTENEAFEVDFLLWKGKDCIAIEVKASSVFQQSFLKGLRALQSSGKLKVKRKILVYLGREKQLTDDNIEILPLGEILDEIEGATLW